MSEVLQQMARLQESHVQTQGDFLDEEELNLHFLIFGFLPKYQLHNIHIKLLLLN
jgi:uncharacterized protein YukJ